MYMYVESAEEGIKGREGGREGEEETQGEHDPFLSSQACTYKHFLLPSSLSVVHTGFLSCANAAINLS